MILAGWIAFKEVIQCGGIIRVRHGLPVETGNFCLGFVDMPAMLIAVHIIADAVRRVAALCLHPVNIINFDSASERWIPPG